MVTELAIAMMVRLHLKYRVERKDIMTGEVLHVREER